MRNSFPIVVSLLMAAVLLSCSMPAKQEQIVAEERKLPVEDMIDIFYEMHKADAILTLNLVKVNGHTDLT
ncbi:MAG: hypothetical protein HUK15_02115, partial [Bacteroidales bacterium]|nr:hypothetical protein [Bacteroidales bacterium]